MPRRIIRNAIQLDALPAGSAPAAAPKRSRKPAPVSSPISSHTDYWTIPPATKAEQAKSAARKAREKAANEERCRKLREQFDAQIAAEGFPPARKEYAFARARIGRKWQLDLSWEPELIVVEIEGRGRHQIWSGYVKDIEKYNRLAAWGWMLVRVTYEMIEDGTAIQWVREAFAYRRAQSA